MNIAKIIALTPGKPWAFTDASGQATTLHPFTVVFDDHCTGQANAKTNPPAYKVGDLVGYDISGQTPRGENKLKITRNPDMNRGKVTSPPPMDSSNPDLEAAPQPRPAYQAPRPVGTITAIPSTQAVHPATVGMAVKIAADFLLREDGWQKDTAGRMESIAGSVIQLAQRLERGESESVPF